MMTLHSMIKHGVDLYKYLFSLVFALLILTAGCGDNSTTPTEPIIPDTPINLSAVSLSDSTVQLYWEYNGSDEIEFQLERSMDDLDNWVVTRLLSANSRSCIDTGLVEGTLYYYKVTAFRGDLFSQPSNVACVIMPPIAPLDLTVTSMTSNMIDLIWTDASNVETGFELQRTLGINRQFVTIATLPENIDTFQDTDLASDQNYIYRIRALLNGISSNWSPEVSAASLPAPTGLIGLALSDSSIWLGWRDESSSETGFLIERLADGSDPDTSEWQRLTSVARNSVRYTDMSVSEGVLYRYQVSALFNELVSPPSNTAEIQTPPRTPVNLVAEQHAEQDTIIQLTWIDKSEIETGFELQRKKRYNIEFSTISLLDPGTVSFDNTGLDANCIYIYRIRSLLQLNGSLYQSNWSNEDTATTTMLTPMRPTELEASALTPNQVRLLWSDKSDNEDGFVIERKVPPEGDWSVIDSLEDNKDWYYDNLLSGNTTYMYRICAYNNHGNSPFSNIAEVTTPEELPLPPSDLHVIEVTWEMVSLEWTDNSDNELGFRFARRLVPFTQWIQIGVPGANVNTFVDTTVAMSTDYAYRVHAFNITGRSEWSEEAVVSVPNGPPGTPEFLHAQAVTSEQINLIWTRTTSNEYGFRVERRSEQNDEFIVIAETNRSIVVYGDTGLEPDTWYWYRIRAFNEIGESGYSNVDSAQTPLNMVFHDSFELYNVGVTPRNQNWDFDRLGSSFVVVTDRDAHEGMKSVMFHDPDNDDSSFCELLLQHDLVRNGNFECWLKVAFNGYFAVLGGVDESYNTFHIQFNGDDTYYVRDDETMVLQENYPENEWFQLRIIFDIDRHEYSVLFNDETVVENLAIPDANIFGNRHIVFRTLPDQVLSRGYLDDVKLMRIGEDD
ncbi:fibronectin type III domain-containing protein [bacterium]|nr:fibronectin type III domain-containing protein [bacterium]